MASHISGERCLRMVPHEPHSWPEDTNRWHCDGRQPKGSMMLTDAERRAELPVETELVDGAWYSFPDGTLELFRPNAVFGDDVPPLYRMAPVARYEPPKPETPEPTGLGAVVRDANGFRWVSLITNGGMRWYGDRGSGRDIYGWSVIPQPVKVLSEGVEL